MGALEIERDLPDQLADLVDEDRQDHPHDSGEDRQHAEHGREHRRPARQTLALKERDEGVETQAQKQRGTDIEQHGGQRLRATDQDDAETDTESGDQCRAERAVDLHVLVEPPGQQA